MSYGMIIGSAVGAVSGIMQQKAQNDAIEEQAKYNNELLEMNDKMNSFIQSANLNRANDVILSYFNTIEKQKREFEVEANQEISKVQNVQLSGITAGNTKARQIQTAYRKVGSSIGKIDEKGQVAINQVIEKTRSDNESLQLNKINNYNNTLAKNSQLAGQAVTGMNAALLVANSSYQYGKSGYGLDEKIGFTDDINSLFETNSDVSKTNVYGSQSIEQTTNLGSLFSIK